MRSFLVRALLVGLLLIAFAVVAAACSVPGKQSLDDETSQVDVAAGRQLFQSNCRACHSLADANAAGVFGPDLDILKPDADTTRKSIDEGGGGMPEDVLMGKDADLVSRYVAQVAGTGLPPEEQQGGRNTVKPTDA